MHERSKVKETIDPASPVPSIYGNGIWYMYFHTTCNSCSTHYFFHFLAFSTTTSKARTDSFTTNRRPFQTHTHTHTPTMISMRPNTQSSFPSSAATHLATPIALVGLSIQARREEKSLKLAFLSAETG